MFYKISLLLRLADFMKITFIAINFPYIFPILLHGLGLGKSVWKAAGFVLFRLSQHNYPRSRRSQYPCGRLKKIKFNNFGTGVNCMEPIICLEFPCIPPNVLLHIPIKHINQFQPIISIVSKIFTISTISYQSYPSYPSCPLLLEHI